MSHLVVQLDNKGHSSLERIMEDTPYFYYYYHGDLESTLLPVYVLYCFFLHVVLFWYRYMLTHNISFCLLMHLPHRAGIS